MAPAEWFVIASNAYGRPVRLVYSRRTVDTEGGDAAGLVRSVATPDNAVTAITTDEPMIVRFLT